MADSATRDPEREKELDRKIAEIRAKNEAAQRRAKAIEAEEATLKQQMPKPLPAARVPIAEPIAQNDKKAPTKQKKKPRPVVAAGREWDLGKPLDGSSPDSNRPTKTGRPGKSQENSSRSPASQSQSASEDSSKSPSKPIKRRPPKSNANVKLDSKIQPKLDKDLDNLSAEMDTLVVTIQGEDRLVEDHWTPKDGVQNKEKRAANGVTDLRQILNEKRGIKSSDISEDASKRHNKQKQFKEKTATRGARRKPDQKTSATSRTPQTDAKPDQKQKSKSDITDDDDSSQWDDCDLQSSSAGQTPQVTPEKTQETSTKIDSQPKPDVEIDSKSEEIDKNESTCDQLSETKLAELPDESFVTAPDKSIAVLDESIKSENTCIDEKSENVDEKLGDCQESNIENILPVPLQGRQHTTSVDMIERDMINQMNANIAAVEATLKDLSEDEADEID